MLWELHKSPSGTEAPPADQGGGKGLAQPAQGLASPACILEVAAVIFPLPRLGWPSLKVRTQGYVSLGPVGETTEPDMLPTHSLAHAKGIPSLLTSCKYVI